jgi:hypothetical protein
MDKGPGPFLQELLRHEGRGDCLHDTICRNCDYGAPRFRCRDCFSTELCCHDCVVATHTKNPTHRIQVSGYQMDEYDIDLE